jgi:hypothetical protein
LLSSGWRVLAIDQEQTALDLLLARVPVTDRDRLLVRATRFDSLEVPPADFVYAGLSLFFCPPTEFHQLWSRVSSSLRRGGRLAAHFLGERDSWATNPDMTSHDADSVRELFTSFTVEYFGETENDDPAASGPKHWHLFEIIARKL